MTEHTRDRLDSEERHTYLDQGRRQRRRHLLGAGHRRLSQQTTTELRRIAEKPYRYTSLDFLFVKLLFIMLRSIVPSMEAASGIVQQR